MFTALSTPQVVLAWDDTAWANWPNPLPQMERLLPTRTMRMMPTTPRPAPTPSFTFSPVPMGAGVCRLVLAVGGTSVWTVD